MRIEHLYVKSTSCNTGNVILDDINRENQKVMQALFEIIYDDANSITDKQMEEFFEVIYNIKPSKLEKAMK